jgi:hypothetical protein
MFKHSSLLDRSRTSLSQLALKRRIHRLKANLNTHLDQEAVEHEYSQLPRCLRDEHLVDAIDHAVDNGLALLARVQAWKFEDGEVVEEEEKSVQDSEEYLKRCVAAVEDIGEAGRALRALVAEEEDDGEHEVEGEEDEENEEQEDA